MDDQARDQGRTVRAKFEVRVFGPDDVHYFDDEVDALRAANAINKEYLADRLRHPNDEVMCVAAVYAGSAP